MRTVRCAALQSYTMQRLVCLWISYYPRCASLFYSTAKIVYDGGRKKRLSQKACATTSPFANKCRLDLFLNLGTLTDSVTKVEEFGATNTAATNNDNLCYVRGVKRKRLLDAATIRYATNREGFGNTTAMLGDNGTLKKLDTLAATLFDFVVYRNGVTNLKLRDLRFQLLTDKSLNFLHDGSSFILRTFMQSNAEDCSENAVAITTSHIISHLFPKCNSFLIFFV